MNAEPEHGERRAEVHYPSEIVSFPGRLQALPVSDPDHYALEILGWPCSAVASRPACTALVYEQQIALSGRRGLPRAPEPGLFEFYVEMKPGETGANGEKALHAELGPHREGRPDRTAEGAQPVSSRASCTSLETNRGAAQMLGLLTSTTATTAL